MLFFLVCVISFNYTKNIGIVFPFILFLLIFLGFEDKILSYEHKLEQLKTENKELEERVMRGSIS